MQGYVPAQDGAFAESRKCFGELEDWMASAGAAGLQHGELEEQLEVRGRELLRLMFQDRLDLAAGDEVRAGYGVADRLPVAGREQRAPAGCGAEPAGGEAFPRAAQARRDRGRARLDGG